MDIRLQLGRNVRKFRLLRGWSQEELSFACGLDRTYISGVERGVRNPTVVVVSELAQALDVAPARLLDESAE